MNQVARQSAPHPVAQLRKDLKAALPTLGIKETDQERMQSVLMIAVERDPDLIHADRQSLISAVRQSNYQYLIDHWRPILGPHRIADTTYRTFKTIQTGMADKGQSTDHIHRMFTMIRTIAKYAKLEGIQGAAEVSSILSDMRIAMPAATSIDPPTREQVMAVVAAAEADGMLGFATGILMQFEFSLRAIDIRGEWQRIKLGVDQKSGIVREGRRWQDGLTWDMFDDDLTHFQKVISKTEKSLTEPYVFDLTHVPHVRDRLQILKQRRSTGPVIVSEKVGGLPYTMSGWAQAWRRYRKAAGLPSTMKASHLRSSGLSEARDLGASPLQLRDAGQHTQTSTTDIYLRGRSATANKVVELRQKGKAK